MVEKKDKNTVIVEQLSVQETLKSVYEALEDKGYNPIGQLAGYILSGDPSYITSHGNARNIIRRISRDDIVEELIREYLGIPSGTNAD
jgi:uncharacterized protein (UPF0297 family)